jgi:hypothetical protein
VFQKRVPREIFGRRNRREEGIGDWRKWHNEELLNLYSQKYNGDDVKDYEINGARMGEWSTRFSETCRERQFGRHRCG